MKKGWFWLVIVILVVGFFIWKSKNREMKRDIKPVVITGTAEQRVALIRKLARRARADMRTIATGLEAYSVDWNAYPPNPYVLTTPIAYLRYVPKDPFTEDTNMGYKKLEGNDWIVWSIGPDGKDNYAKTNYDPAKGLESKGDIMRRKQ